MFEQSTLTSPPASKRFWATCLGVTGQVALVAGATLAPLLWPQILPPATLLTSLVSPGPPPPPKVPVVRPTQVVKRQLSPFVRSGFYQPTTYVAHAAILVDPPPEVASGGIDGGVVGGTPGGSGDGLVGTMLQTAAAPVPVHTAEPTHVAPVAAVTETRRVKVGGVVRMAALIHRVEPVYPPLAKQMRVSGIVELRGVIGTDGHLREVTLVSGHALLARAAIDAVSQWVYAPTQLNGDPVEVIAPITVTFRLSN